MNAGPRLITGPLVPGGLTVGQENRVVSFITTRTGIRSSSLWEAFSAADRNATAMLNTYIEKASVDYRARSLSLAEGITATDASFLVGLAVGLRMGLTWGRVNSNRERARSQAARRERENPIPAPDPEAVRAANAANLEAARRWSRGHRP